ncbi:thiamine pyrophosphate-binding protein [Homoserinimonas sp. A447]
MSEPGQRSISNGGELLVAVMDALGIDTAFGVVSVHNLPLVDAIARDRRFVPVRNEAAAVNAADAYGRVRGTIGLAITSTGTGAGNAAGALIESLSAGTSVLHVTGQIESQYLGKGRGFIHETQDQSGMLKSVSKAAYTIYSADSAADILCGAAAESLSSPSGPVSVEWPIDLQYSPQSVTELSITPAEPRSPDPAAVALAVELIREARRPLLWAGGGAIEARSEVEAFLSTTRAGLLTSNAGRGVVHEGHGSCIGNFASSPASADILEKSDLMISIGTHFRSNETKDYELRLPARHIQIDVDPAAIGRTYPTDVGIVGDAALSLRAMTEALPTRTQTEDDWLTEVARVRRLARQTLRGSIGWQASICDAVRAAFPRGAIFARDVTIPSSTWGNRLLAIDSPRENVFPRGGGIGQGVAMGLGAAISQPALPTLVMVGDGGISVSLGELLTLAQENPWVVVLVFNDRGYGVLRNTQDSHFGRRSGVDLATADFGMLAKSLALPYWNVSSLEQVEEALAAALTVGGAAVVEVDVDAFGPMPTPFLPPVRIPDS